MRRAWLAVAAATVALAAMPRFAQREFVLSGGVPIDVGAYGSPLMFDWDRDGKKDVLMGTFRPGNIRFYRNVGEDSAPAFNGFVHLQARGQDIELASA
jgi:hypothetical protein